MAFGVRREELEHWKRRVKAGHIVFLTHFWYDARHPSYRTVTKVGCSDIPKLICWGAVYQLQPQWIDQRSDFPHFDLRGEKQLEILKAEGLRDQMNRFGLNSGR